jgi:hypothetical protein
VHINLADLHKRCDSGIGVWVGGTGDVNQSDYERLGYSSRVGRVGPGSDASGAVGNIRSKGIIGDRGRYMLHPAEGIFSRTYGYEGALYSAMASLQLSPRPWDSTTCRHLAVPPPVIRFVSPCVISWVTISFSKAPSRRGCDRRLNGGTSSRNAKHYVGKIPQIHVHCSQLATGDSLVQGDMFTGLNALGGCAEVSIIASPGVLN